MGYPPPPDGPKPEELAAANNQITFPSTPPIPLICGLTLPPLSIPALPFKIPKLGLPFSFPPTFSFVLSLTCTLKPSGGITTPFGGGRFGTVVPQPFDSDV